MYVNMMTGVYVADDGLNPSDLFSGTKRKRSTQGGEKSSVCRTEGCGTKLREKNRSVGFCECCQRRRATN